MAITMRTLCATPVFNTPDLRSVFTFPLPLDDQGLLRPVETALFKGALVTIVKQWEAGVVQIKTDEYAGDQLFTHIHFLESSKDDAPRLKHCPSLEDLLGKLQKWPQTEYIWGANTHEGIPLLAKLYPMPEEADIKTRFIWMMKGVDCSGLFYEATDGFLPRNTSQLMNIGQPVTIEGKLDEEIAERLIPGDLIVWRGHVLIVERGRTLFESRIGDGTIRTPIVQRLQEIRRNCGRLPVDDASKHLSKGCYVARRWHPDVLSGTVQMDC